MLPLKEIVEYGVIGVLVLMSIVSLWASFERMLFYRYIKLVLYNNKIELAKRGCPISLHYGG